MHMKRCSISLNHHVSHVTLLVKNQAANVGDDFRCWFNPMRRKWKSNPVFLPGKSHEQRGSWWATVHGVTKSWTRLKWLSMHTCMLTWLDHQIFSSVQSSHSVVSNSLQPHESQHTRPPCPSPTPVVYSNSCPSSRWCHPAISSSVVPFSSCPQFLPASGSFTISQLFAWGGQSIGVSASASVLPMNTQD